MDCRARRVGVEPSAVCQANIERILSVWESCRRNYSQDGPWLFGKFSIADAMYAPVASRFATYGVSLPQIAQDYISTIFEHSGMQEWLKAAEAEPEIIQESERGQPAP